MKVLTVRRTLLCFVVLLLAMVVGLCGYLRIYRYKDAVAYYGMAKECHPVWKELALRRYHRGDPVEKLTEKWPPSERRVEAGYEFLTYYDNPDAPGLRFTGLAVVAEDRRLLHAYAWSCCWQHSFFGSQEELEEFFERIYPDETEQEQDKDSTPAASE